MHGSSLVASADKHQKDSDRINTDSSIGILSNNIFKWPSSGGAEQLESPCQSSDQVSISGDKV
jgi:hypothetical protein